MTKIKRKVVYVVLREHYHSPPNDPDMVAATPIYVYPGHDTGRIDGKRLAKKLAQEHCSRFGGEVKEHTTSNKEYRVWVDSPNEHCARFVYVVRETEYVG